MLRITLSTVSYFVVLLLVWCNQAYAEELGAFDQPMTFALAGNGGNCTGCEWVSAIGVIDQSTPGRLQEFIKEHGNYKWTMELHSPGGDLFAGIKLGRLIREFELDTSVGATTLDEDSVAADIPKWETVKPGVCVSACAYAFLGGINRSVSEGSTLGFHQFYRDPEVTALSNSVNLAKTGLADGQIAAGIIVAYLVEMGIDARVLTIAAAANPDEIITPKLEELEALGIVTRTGFGDWWIEPYGDGLIAAAKRLDSYSEEQQVTIYCRGERPQIYLLVTLAGYGGTYNDVDLSQSIFNASLSIDSSTEALQPADITFKDTGADYLATIRLSPMASRKIINAHSVGVAIDMPHAVFNYGVHATLNITKPARRMIQLVSRNCI